MTIDVAACKPSAKGAIDEAADAYDALGEDYVRYADGDTEQLFAFDGRYGFADREVWTRIEAALVGLRTQGRRSIRILDLGCGPGTWLLRTTLRARALGFADIEAVGVDVSQELIAIARTASARTAVPGVNVAFEVADLLGALAAERDRSADLTMCLYGVLNHLPLGEHRLAAAEMARVTDGHLIVTVRSVDSLPSIFVAGMEAAQSYCYDSEAERLEIELKDGRRLAFGFHLFTAAELKAHFDNHLELQEIVGIDLFHSRFAPEPCWSRSTASEELEHRLTGLERLCCKDAALIDHAAHILLAGTPRLPGVKRRR